MADAGTGPPLWARRCAYRIWRELWPDRVAEAIRWWVPAGPTLLAAVGALGHTTLRVGLPVPLPSDDREHACSHTAPRPAALLQLSLSPDDLPDPLPPLRGAGEMPAVMLRVVDRALVDLSVVPP